MKFKDFLESSKLFDELISEENQQHVYAIDILEKITKVAEYLIKSKLNNASDLSRFEKFLDMLEKELPKLNKSIQAVKSDLSHSQNYSQTPRRYNYYK